MYKPLKIDGDSLPVPQLVFSRLTTSGAQEGHFRVALYILSTGGAQAEDVAKALGLSLEKVQAALHYWEGAGLIERQPQTPVLLAAEEQKPHRVSIREAVRMGEANPLLGFLLQELQRVFGRALGEKEASDYINLFVVEQYSADLILMAASHAMAHDTSRVAYVKKVLLSWRKEGIEDCAAADKHLKQIAHREETLRQFAQKLGLEWDPFTLAEKKKITLWFEEYGYGWDIIEAARISAGERNKDIPYLAGILKKWNAHGYKSAKDVQQSGGGQNLRVTGGRVAPQEDILMNTSSYVPLRREEKS